MPKYVLGVSAFCHDAAAALLKDGKIIAAAQEERFTRRKYDSSFPENAIGYCLHEAGIGREGLDLIAFHDDSHKKDIKKNHDSGDKPLFYKQYISCAASAFYPSPFNEAAILVTNGLNSPVAAAFGTGKSSLIKVRPFAKFPDSIGLLYSAFTYYCGFNPSADEYKLMGLAPYGEPVYTDLILKRLINLNADGACHINSGYFNYRSKNRMANKKFNDIFGGHPRGEGDKIEKKHKDMARSIQAVAETVLMAMVYRLHKETKLENLCMAGEMALNCVANGRILREGPFKRMWIQPAPSDAGCAIGAALLAWHDHAGKNRKVNTLRDSQGMSLLGPSYSDEEIERYLKENNIKYIRFERSELLKKAADLLADGKVVGWFQGRMEFGPRALGNRSILADPRIENMKDRINSRIKFREPFRPFAPSVLLKEAGKYFDIRFASPYMLFVSNVKKKGLAAITHVDNSARVQTVRRNENSLFYDLIDRLRRDHGCPVVINTSFNRMGEPIVCTPKEAYECFMKTETDYLVIGSFIVRK